MSTKTRIMVDNSKFALYTYYDNLIRQNIALLSTVHSANQYLKEIDTADIPNGYVAIADEQTTNLKWCTLTI